MKQKDTLDKKLYCNRCKRVLGPREYVWMWNQHYCRSVPVCKDDRLCYEKVVKRRRW